MYDKELNLQEIQQEMLKTVLKIDEICSLLNIKYSLAFGSLIGAVRHKGFIPWDDDLDIWMTRKDLNIFTEYCNTHAQEIQPFKLCSRGNIKNYSYNIPRFANLDFEYINTDEHQSAFEIGIFVDIYPIEGYGNTEAEGLKLFKKCKRLNTFYDIYVNPNSRKNTVNTYIKKIISTFIHFIYKDKYYKHQEKVYEKYMKKNKTNSKYVGCVCWASVYTPYLRKDILNSEGKLDCIILDFEGHKLSALRNYDAVLKAAFGNYMQLPPESERHPYHKYKIYKKEKK